MLINLTFSDFSQEHQYSPTKPGIFVEIFSFLPPTARPLALPTEFKAMIIKFNIQDINIGHWHARDITNLQKKCFHVYSENRSTTLLLLITSVRSVCHQTMVASGFYITVRFLGVRGFIGNSILHMHASSHKSLSQMKKLFCLYPMRNKKKHHYYSAFQPNLAVNKPDLYWNSDLLASWAKWFFFISH